MRAAVSAPPRWAEVPRRAALRRLAAAGPGRRAGIRRLAECALVGATSVALAAWALGLWRADLGLPLRYAPVDDTKFYLMLVKGIIEHGSYLSNPSLGFPFGQHLADYPQGADDLNWLLIRGLAVFSSSPGLVVNLFFLLTFALTSVCAHLVLRAEGISAPVAGVVSVLFSLLPYHFFRGESHLLLSAYYSIPLAAHLFLRLLAERPLFARRHASAGRKAASLASRRTLTTLAICVVIGSDNLYYAVFGAVLLVGAVLTSLVVRRRRAALGGLAALALIAATLGANLAPTLVYQAEHGANPRLERSAAADQSSNEALWTVSAQAWISAYRQTSPSTTATVLSVLGNHDALVSGETTADPGHPIAGRGRPRPVEPAARGVAAGGDAAGHDRLA